MSLSLSCPFEEQQFVPISSSLSLDSAMTKVGTIDIVDSLSLRIAANGKYRMEKPKPPRLCQRTLLSNLIRIYQKKKEIDK